MQLVANSLDLALNEGCFTVLGKKQVPLNPNFFLNVEQFFFT